MCVVETCMELMTQSVDKQDQCTILCKVDSQIIMLKI